MALRKGEDIEVWSNSQSKWFPGKVEDVLDADGDIEGYRFAAGSIKVSSAAGSKWIPVDQISAVVRRSSESRDLVRRLSEASVCSGGYAGGAPGGPAKCKHGCGRPVQPGLTRGMKKFDTCCKSCGLYPGRGIHDANCGGGDKPVASVDGSDASFLGPNPKDWLADLLAYDSTLHTHALQIFKTLSAGESRLTLDKLSKAVNEYLMQPVHVKLSVSDAALQGMARSDSVDQVGFLAICKRVLEDRQQQYFPQKLITNTSHFVCKNSAKSKEVYEFKQKLGEGSYGKVFAVTHNISGENRVCKSIATSSGAATMTMTEILGEIQNMAMLDHPNVIKVYEYFDEDNHVLQILELCQGGELQDRIDDVFRKGKPRYTEEFMCDVMKQILRALAFMHSQRYMHKDLKPQNIMMVDKESSSIKVIDFGLAELFKKDQKTTKNWGGTLLYMAPEVFKQELAFKSDIWSAGVILYNLLTGGYPFIGQWPLPPGKDVAWWEGQTEELIRNMGRTYAPHRGLDLASPECVDLLNRMLTKDVSGRPDAVECLNHPWFRRFDNVPPPLSVGLSQCLQAYAGAPELKKSIFLLMAHQCTAPAIQELRAIFTHFDTSNSGSLSTATVRDVLQRSGQSRLTVESTVHALDRDDSGHVQWTEFLAAALCIYFIGADQRRLVDAAFACIDRAGPSGSRAIGSADFMNTFAHSKVDATTRGTWSRLLPDEIAKVASTSSITARQFVDYMCRRMNTAAGDALQAVQ